MKNGSKIRLETEAEIRNRPGVDGVQLQSPLYVRTAMMVLSKYNAEFTKPQI